MLDWRDRRFTGEHIPNLRETTSRRGQPLPVRAPVQGVMVVKFVRMDQRWDEQLPCPRVPDAKSLVSRSRCDSPPIGAEISPEHRIIVLKELRPWATAL